MKPIELTAEHKDKLLEMCKVLFPNDKIDSFQFENIKFLINHYIKKDSKNSKITFEGWDEILEIHWFEFCMTHLMYKLSYEFSKIPNIKGRSIHIELWELNKGDYFKKHPVDYLYEEFLKLK